jgi:hypothetical protein
VITLLILEKNKDSLLQDETFTSGKTKDQWASLLLERAWEIQVIQNPPRSSANIDCEAIGLLERRMFQTSKAAGKACYQQWGIDAGNHQGKLSP